MLGAVRERSTGVRSENIATQSGHGLIDAVKLGSRLVRRPYKSNYYADDHGDPGSDLCFTLPLDVGKMANYP